MQNQTPRRNSSKRKSLYSKFKSWCAFHRIPTLLIPIIVLFVVAVTAILIGGSIAGWDIKGFLTSPTGTLMYVIILLGILGLAYYLVFSRRR